MGYLYDFLTWMMDGCYRLCHNYGAAVVLFTFLSRIVLIPVTVWTYRNSVTMMKMQADIIKAQADALAQLGSCAELDGMVASAELVRKTLLGE